MKRLATYFLFAAALFSLASCSDPDKMLTVINPDGSCYKQFTNEVGKDFMLGREGELKRVFPVVVDSTWIVTWKTDQTELDTHFPITQAEYDSICKLVPPVKDTVTGKVNPGKVTFHVLIRKNFSSVEDMAAHFRLKDDYPLSRMKVKYAFRKQFKGFYTEYEYKETYPKLVTNFRIPLEKFMTPDEIRFWFTGDVSQLKGMNGIEVREFAGDVEDKYNYWYVTNTWNNEFDVLLKNYPLVKHPPVSKEKLAALRDSIFSKEVKDDDFKMVQALSDFFGTKAFNGLWEDGEKPMHQYEKSFEEQSFVQYFHNKIEYNLQMPGKVTVPDNVRFDGKTLTWNLTAYRMVHDDFVIEAHSRKANAWVFVVAGLVVLLAAGSFFWKPRRKERRN